MFNCENEPLALLVELTPKLAKKRYRESIYEAWEHKCGYCSAPATCLDNIIPLPCREVSDEGQWVFVEFPYKHLLPTLEAA